MFCGNCGNKLSDGAIFCGYCGSKVPQIEPEAVAPVVETPAAPVFEPVAPVVETPAAPVYAPVAEQPQYQPTYQPPQYQPQYQPQQYQPQQYQPQYQPPSYDLLETEPKKKGNKKLLVCLGLVALVAIAGFLLWYFVLSGGDSNSLAGTKWMNDDGMYIEFVDGENVRLGEMNYYGEMQYQNGTYKLSGNKLTLTADNLMTSSEMTYKRSDGKLYLTMYGQTVEFENAKNTFECESCHELSTGKKHTGQMQGYTYSFCDDCWDEVKDYFD